MQSTAGFYTSQVEGPIVCIDYHTIPVPIINIL